MKALPIVALLVACGCATLRPTQPEPPPDTVDAAILGGAVVLIGVDVAQSIEGSELRGPGFIDGHGFRETDPVAVWLLGRYPRPAGLVGVGVLSTALMITAWALLPERWRWIVPTGIGAGELVNVSVMTARGL